MEKNLISLQMKNIAQYDHYKDSNIDWIGALPSHWELKPFRSLFHFRNEKNNPVKTENILSLSIAKGITQYTEEGRGGNKRKDDLSDYKLAYPGDIVINSMNVIVGAVGLSKFFGAISPDYYAIYLKSEQDNIDFYENTFLDESFQRGLLRYGKGILMKLSGTGKLNTIRMKVSTNDLKKIYFPHPPKSEQNKIVEFLKEKTTQIDQAINIKERQIILLKERKQTIIQNAVTKGIKVNTPLKESGLKWVDKIPAHWRIEKAKWLFKKEDRPVQNNDEIITCFRDGQVTLRKNRRIEGFTNALQEIGYQRICIGDLVIHGMDAFAGAIGVSDSNGKSSPVYSVCSPKKKNTVKTQYYAFVLRNLATSGVIQSLAKGIRERSTDFRFNDFGALQLPLPPIEEQQEIIDYISFETAKIERGINLQLEQIKKFKEYKGSLINMVISGKIKVT